jgi:hypothetical protein
MSTPSRARIYLLGSIHSIGEGKTDEAKQRYQPNSKLKSREIKGKEFWIAMAITMAGYDSGSFDLIQFS